MRNTLAALDQLWEAALPRFTPDEQRAALVLLRELSNGEPVVPERFARALDIPADAADRLLDSTLRPFVDRRAYGRVEGFFGLATRPTPHRFDVGDRVHWTWCAEDSPFLPELLGATARVESSDPATGDPVRLTISPARIEAAEPEDLTVSMVFPR
jgi:alkylmercury lyase